MRVPNPLYALVLAGWLLGGLEAGIVVGHTNGAAAGPIVVTRLAAGGLGAALGAAPALLLGLVAWLLLWLLAHSARARAAANKIAAWWQPPATAERGPIVARHARAAGIVFGAGLFLLGARLLLARLWRLQATDLAQLLAVAGLGMLGLACVAIGAAFARFFLGRLSTLDQRTPLPWPHDPLLRYVAFVLIPGLLALMPVLHRYRALLGPATTLGWLLGLVIVAGATALLAGQLAALVPRGRRLARIFVLLGGPGSIVLGVAMAGRNLEFLGRTENGVGAALGAQLLRALSDVDRDGVPALLGGNDCAPFDGARSPLAAEIPGNGIDENCDGTDDAPLVAPFAAYSDALHPSMVRRYHVFWLIPDGVRADRVGAFGQPRDVTPYLDALATDSLQFNQAYSQSSATVFSFNSMFTGLNPESMRWHQEGVWPATDTGYRSVAERLHALGYRTAIFVSDWMRKVYPGLLRGYDYVIAPRATDNWAYWSQQTSPMTTTQVIELIERLDPAAGPLFVTVHYGDPHFPYVEHPGVAAFGPRALDRYDGELAFTDRSIGFLLDYLRYREPLWANSVVLVSSDHGEEFGEHGRQNHARACYDESTHVPLLLRVPGITPAVIDSPVGLVDLAPTVLELVGAPRDPKLQGQSLLVPVLVPARTAPNRALFCAVASQYRAPERFFERSIRQGDYLLLEDVLAGRTELYDRRTDPAERSNRVADPALAQERDLLESLLRQDRTGNFGAELP